VSDVIGQLRAALADRYRLERELGQGGMATVYLADDLKHDRQVALKVLRPDLAAVLGTERFLSEIKITAGLDHPHILTLIDSGSAAGFLYYVLPLVRGESLRDKLNREKQLGLDEALTITKQVAGALDYAHRRGVIHRDIKPENILLQDGEAMLTDFGIALAVHEAGGARLTETGLAVGTQLYMSPEQSMAERDLNGRSDIYSLGCVLYEMLAGEPPYTGPTGQAVIAKRMTLPVPSVRTLRETVPEAVDRALMSALAKSPADRFATAAEFATALEGGKTVRAPFLRRPHLLTRNIALAALTTTLVILGAWFVVKARRPAVEPSTSVIAVLPFAPSTPDSALTLLGKDLMQTVSATLDQVGGLTTVDRFKILQKADQATPYSLTQAAALGREFGAGSFIHGGLVRDGADVRLELGIYRTDNHAPLGPVVVVRASPDSLTTLSDSATWAILRQIWHSGTPPSPSIADITTHSIPALREFLDGEREAAADHYQEAAAAFHRAAVADTTFWAAGWRYNEAQGWMDNDDDTTLKRRYEAHPSAFIPRDRLIIGTEKTSATERYEAHLARAQAVATQFPDDWPAWFFYGDHLFHGGPLIGHTNAEARAALQRTVDLNSRMVPAWGHLFYASLGHDSAQSGRALRERVALGAYDEQSKDLGFDASMFDRVAQSASEQLSLPLLDSLATAIAGTKKVPGPPPFLLMFGFPAAQIEFNLRMLKLVSGGSFARRAWRGIAYAWVVRGAWDSALVALDRSAAASPDEASAVDTYRLAVVGAWLGALDAAQATGRRAAAVKYLGGLPLDDSTSAHDGRASLAWADGMLAVLRQDQHGLATARRSVQQSGAESADFMNRSLAAFEMNLQGATRQAADSLAALDLAASETELLGPRDPYARSIDHLQGSRWLLQLGDTSRAVRLLTWHEADWDRLVFQLFAPLAYYELARIEEAQGLNDLAREHYLQFLRRYDTPVPDHQHLVDEAKAALRKLNGPNDPPAPR
jgi:serine/threonine protein kinase